MGGMQGGQSRFLGAPPCRDYRGVKHSSRILSPVGEEDDEWNFTTTMALQ